MTRLRLWRTLKPLAIALSLALAGTAQAAPGDVLLVSAPNSVDPADSAADVVPATSGTGAFVAFLHEGSFSGPSEAIPGTSLQLRSMATETIVPVDVPSGETDGLGYDAGSPSLDRGGRFLSFVSENPDLSQIDRDFSTSAAGTNPVRDAFVYDRVTRRVELISRRSGRQGSAANDDSNLPAISADGRYVAFGTEANNLVPKRAFGRVVFGGVYVRDRKRGTTTLVSRADGRDGAPLDGFDPSISAGGEKVAFVFLVGRHGDRRRAIYVRDLRRGRTIVASRSRGRDCVEPALAADGRFVAYTCEAKGHGKGLDQVYVTDLASGRVMLVSRGAGGKGSPGGGDSSRPSISASGRLVAFESYANDLGPRDEGRIPDVFVKDVKSGRVVLASRADGFGAAGNAPSASPAISADGRFVSFESKASNLVAQDSDRNSSVFRYQILP